MKKKLLSMLCLLCACITASAADITSPWSWTAAKPSPFQNQKSGATVTLGSIDWTYDYDKSSITQQIAGTASNQYIQFCSKSTCCNVTLTTSAFKDYTITKVTVNTWSKDANAKTLSVKVGDTTLGTQNTSSSSSDLVFTGSAKGDNLIIEYGGTTNNQYYLKSITVEFEEAGQAKPAAPAAPYFTDEDGIVIADGATVEEGTIIMVVSDTEGAVALFVDNDEAVDELYEVNYGEAESLTLKAQATVTVDGVTSDPSEVSAITIHKPVKVTPVFTVTPAPGAHVNGTQLSVSATLDGAELDSDEWLVSVTPEVLNFDSEHTSITVKAEAMDPETEEVYEKSYTYTWRATAAPVLSDGGLGDTITITAEDADRMIVAIDPSDFMEEIEGNTFTFSLTHTGNIDVTVSAVAIRDGYADAETVKVYTIKHPEGYNNEYYSEDTYTLITSTDELDTTGQRKYVLSGTHVDAKDATKTKSALMGEYDNKNKFDELVLPNVLPADTKELDVKELSGYKKILFEKSSTTNKFNLYTYNVENKKKYINGKTDAADVNEADTAISASLSFQDDNTVKIEYNTDTRSLRYSFTNNAYKHYANSDNNSVYPQLWGQKLIVEAYEPAEMRIVPSAENESKVVKGYKLELRAVDSKWADVEGAKIYYAVSEGTINPFTDYKLYTGPVTIDTDCYVYVLAIADGYKTADSDLTYFTTTVEYEVAAAGHEFREPEKVEYTGGDGEARFTFGNYYIIMAQDGEGNVWAKSTTRTADGYKAVNLGSVTDGKIGVGITEDPVAEYALFKHATAGTYAMMQHTVASWGADKDEAEAMAEWREGATYLHHDHFNHAVEPAEARVTAAEATAEPAYMTLTHNSVTMPNGHALSFNADTKEFVCDCNAGASAAPLMLAATTGNGGISTGVENVEAEAEGDAQWYNLQGIEVNGESLTPGIYVRRQGESVTKVLVR